MQNYILAKTTKSPKVIMDAEKGRIEFKGSSIMENSRAYYDPIFKWVAEYVKEPKDTQVHIDLDYFNSSSAKAFLTLFKTLIQVKESGCNLHIEWCYTKDDDDMIESGKNYASVIEAEFDFIEKQAH